MKVPTDLFLSGISERKIYYFSTVKINSLQPHYFICIKRMNNDLLIMSCCTSQFETINRFITSRKLPKESLVWIEPDPQSVDNPFTKDTYVNCNSYLTYTLDEFKSMYESGTISYSGELSEDHYIQLLIGIHSSPLVDNETKETLPLPEHL